MALTYQNVPISFAQGVDTKTDAKQVVPGKLLELENGVFYQSRSIKKRDGFDDLPTTTVSGGTITAGSAIATFKNSMIEYTDGGANGYVQDIDKWSDITGVISPMRFSSTSVIQSAATYKAADSAYHAGTDLVVSAFSRQDWSGNKTFFYTVFERSTGTVIVPEGVVSSVAVSYFKTVLLGDVFYIIYLETAGTTLKFVRVDTATPNVYSSVTGAVSDFFDGFSPFDATVFNSKVYVAYYSSNATRSVGHFTITGTTVSAVSYQTERASECITVFGDSANNLWVGVGDDTNGVKGWAYNAALSSLVVPVTVLTSATTSAKLIGIHEPASSPSKGRYFVEFRNAAGDFYNNINEYQLTSAGLGTNYPVAQCLGIGGKPFYSGSNLYFLAAYRTYTSAAPGRFTQPSFFLLQPILNALGVVAAKVAPQIAGSEFPESIYASDQFTGPVPEVWSHESGVFNQTYPQTNDTINITVFSSPLTVPIWGIQLGTFDFSEPTRTLEVTNSLYSFGGLASVFDGGTITEQGFNLYPEEILFGADTGSGNVGMGTYSYVATYEWTDKFGQVHRSAPSAPFSHTVSLAARTVNMTVSTLNLTQKTNVKVGLYRTQNAGTVYYFVNYFDLPGGLGDTVTATDTVSDAEIVAQGVLYTTGGAVENISLPAPLTMGTFKNRVVVVPSENPSSFWYSKEVVQGSPVEFSDLFVQNIDQKGGGISGGVIQMDDKLCLFKESNIFVLTGDGPADSGANNDFTPAQEIASDSGCINDRSLVLMPMGVMYQSAKGIYLLGRNLQVSYIGADVEAYNNNVITSAKLYPKRNQVIFTLDSGVALVFDYAFSQWSVFTGIDAVGTTVYQDKIAYVKSDGTVMLETPGVFTDAGSGYSLKLKTSWLSFAGLQGFQRVYSVLLLGEYKSSHTLRVECAHDFVDTIDQTIDIVASSTPPFQYGCDFKYQKAQAVQLTIQDVSPTGESLELSNMAFEVGVKQGSFRVGQERTNA